jgi:plasmid replication initiation protein
MTQEKALAPRKGTTALDRAIELATPQSLVHIKHSISLQQYKYFLLLFDEMSLCMGSGIEPDEKGFYTIRMEKLAEKITYTPNKKELWSDFVKLKNETIAVNYLMKDGKPITYGAGYISEWGISNSFIKFKFPSFFVEVAQKFKEQRKLFLQLNWEIFNSFTGKYEAILYKLCKDYEKSGGKRTPEFSVEGFREYMGLNENEYFLFKDLNKYCISKPSQKINESDISDISITSHFVKTGKFVSGLYFSIESRNQLSLAINTDNSDDPFMLARVPIPMTVQTQYLKSHTLDDAKLCIEAANEWIDAKIKAGEPVVHGRAYRSALEGNWQPNKPALDKQVQELDSKKEKEKQVELNKNLDSQTVQENKKLEREKIIEQFNALPYERQNAIRKDFEMETTQTILESWNKSKLNTPENPETAPAVKVVFFRFVKEVLNA